MINKVSRLSLSLQQFIERRTGFAVSSSSKRSPILTEGGLRHTVEDILSRLTDFFADIYIYIYGKTYRREERSVIAPPTSILMEGGQVGR